jgi:hypothetical protein
MQGQTGFDHSAQAPDNDVVVAANAVLQDSNSRGTSQMATITNAQLVDDLDGSRAEVPVLLRIDSELYQLNLSKANYDKYIAPLVRAAVPGVPLKVERRSRRRP